MSARLVRCRTCPRFFTQRQAHQTKCPQCRPTQATKQQRVLVLKDMRTPEEHAMLDRVEAEGKRLIAQYESRLGDPALNAEILRLFRKRKTKTEAA